MKKYPIPFVKREGWPTGVVTHRGRYYLLKHRPFDKYFTTYNSALRYAEPGDLIVYHLGTGYFVYYENPATKR